MSTGGPEGDEKIAEESIVATETDDETLIAGGTIIMGTPGTEPILGVTALESVGIDVDPRNQTLKRLPAVRLKTLRAGFHSG